MHYYDEKITFSLTQDHLKLLQAMNIRWQGGEVGAPGADPKRPYGNSSVEDDIIEILGWERREDEYGEICQDLVDEVRRVHRQTEFALRIVLETGSFSTGVYEGDAYGRNWKKVQGLPVVTWVRYE
jgi:hypothetical protein